MLCPDKQKHLKKRMLNLDDFFSLRIEEAGFEMTVIPRANNQLEAIDPIVVWAVSEEASVEAEGTNTKKSKWHHI